MKVIEPDYYKKFVCIADKCRHNCCEGGWIVKLSEDNVEKYKSLDSAFGKRLMDSITKDEDGDWCFVMENGKCPFLNEDGLCSVYRQLGEEYMGVVCREFTRFCLYYGNIREQGIGLACEEAARIILENTGKLVFEEHWEDSGDVAAQDEDEEYLTVLEKARDILFSLLWSGEGTMNERIRKVLFFADGLQQEVNSEDTDRMREYLSKVPAKASVKEKGRKDVVEGLMEVYENLEQLNQEWSSRADKIGQWMLEGDFTELYRCLPNGGWLPYNLMTYFLYRYFMKAVYDYDVLGKVKLAVCNFAVLSSMFGAAQAEKGDLSMEDLIEEARVFSRQVEYSEDNIEAICEEFDFGDDFSTERIGLLFA